MGKFSVIEDFFPMLQIISTDAQLLGHVEYVFVLGAHGDSANFKVRNIDLL